MTIKLFFKNSNADIKVIIFFYLVTLFFWHYLQSVIIHLTGLELIISSIIFI